MSGTVEGGRKAHITNIQKHGKDFYREIGRLGGMVYTTKPKGFAANPERAKLAGAKGGARGKRKGMADGTRKNISIAHEMKIAGYSLSEIAKALNRAEATVYNYLKVEL